MAPGPRRAGLPPLHCHRKLAPRNGCSRSCRLRARSLRPLTRSSTVTLPRRTVRGVRKGLLPPPPLLRCTASRLRRGLRSRSPAHTSTEQGETQCSRPSLMLRGRREQLKKGPKQRKQRIGAKTGQTRWRTKSHSRNKKRRMAGNTKREKRRARWLPVPIQTAARTDSQRCQILSPCTPAPPRASVARHHWSPCLRGRWPHSARADTRTPERKMKCLRTRQPRCRQGTEMDLAVPPPWIAMPTRLEPVVQNRPLFQRTRVRTMAVGERGLRLGLEMEARERTQRIATRNPATLRPYRRSRQPNRRKHLPLQWRSKWLL
mmetsp:Transcript_2778/g.7969  ORF Transcript_2778/g.7969 Transcript_2778/m.7969 type:complete len:318 (+) Transcript_2778:512-1465(+)